MLSPARATDPYDIPKSPITAKSPADVDGVVVAQASPASAPLESRDDEDVNSSAQSNGIAPADLSKDTTETNTGTSTPLVDAANGNDTAEPAHDQKTEDSVVARAASESAPQDAPAAATDADAADAAVAPNASGEVEIEDFVDHRVDKDNATVEIQVRWATTDNPTWEPEWSLQSSAPSLVYKYWEERGGRDKATGLDVYHVFRILRRSSLPSSVVRVASKKAAPTMLRVQWVGYQPGESSWEREDKVREIAPGELARFEAKNGPVGGGLSDADPTRKRGVARAPGRPKKKAKLQDS